MTEPSERAGQPGQDPPPPPPPSSPIFEPSAQPWPVGHPVHPVQPTLPPNRKRRPWLIAGIAGWAVLLLVLTYLSVGRDEPTVREQRSIAQAIPVVNRALGEIIVAAGPDVVVELSSPRLVEGCRLSLVRDGATLEQDVTFRTVESQERALISRIAQGLPKDYRARSRASKGTLRADAGEFVGIEGGLTEPGTVKLTATTGCRPGLPADVGELLPEAPRDDEPVRVLAALGVTDHDPVTRAVVRCPDDDGQVRASRVVGRGAVSKPLDATLRPLAGADPVVVMAQTDRYAYRSGSRSVVVEAVDGEIRVTVTESGCAS